ncbi:hypothetical protein GR28A_00101 [Vibrio phage vB_VcorM_GR28A]|nr:hypothetical protein GR28A_00101 [Vibrio phage vB_VcorM_GR28A]
MKLKLLANRLKRIWLQVEVDFFYRNVNQYDQQARKMMNIALREPTGPIAEDFRRGGQGCFYYFSRRYEIGKTGACLYGTRVQAWTAEEVELIQRIQQLLVEHLHLANFNGRCALISKYSKIRDKVGGFNADNGEDDETGS